jgi:hypothetical protein
VVVGERLCEHLVMTLSKLLNAERAFVPIEKLAGYALNPSHPTGKHKARVFKSALGLTEDDAPLLQKKLREIIVMKLYDVVALIEPLPEYDLERGQVGTIVEEWEPGVYEVEFADTNGVAYAIVAVEADKLMVLHWQRTEASA